MEDAGGQFDSMPEANPMTEATANDVVQSKKASGSFQGQVADAPAGGSLFWKQKQLEVIRLISSQEEASNQLSSGIATFVEKTATMKKVCTPSSPRAPWWIRTEDPLWSSKRNYYKLLHSIAPERCHVTVLCRGIEIFTLSSPRALWRIIRHKALRKIKKLALVALECYGGYLSGIML
jgi:hypothetical protein